jgi:hypothetical protein
MFVSERIKNGAKCPVLHSTKCRFHVSSHYLVSRLYTVREGRGGNIGCSGGVGGCASGLCAGSTVLYDLRFPRVTIDLLILLLYIQSFVEVIVVVIIYLTTIAVCQGQIAMFYCLLL